MPRPTIQDVIVVAELTKYEKDGVLQTIYPIGEAPMGGQTSELMTATERVGMEERLFHTINDLINVAAATHLEHRKVSGTDEVNQEFITRLSTNEFFFYTQEPLTLKEFEVLQNKIATVVESFPPGIHLILGSFAVKTDDNKVMNIIPHISSGKPAAFQFIVKNHTSPEDFCYKETSGAVPVLDSTIESAELPSISVGGVQQQFTFNNIVRGFTPSGTKLNTIVDVCLDHNYGVGKKYITEIEAGIKDEAISHLVTSNSTHLTTAHCFGPVTHVDPEHSSQKYKPSVAYSLDRAKQFGHAAIKIYEASPTQCLLLSEARKKQIQDSAAVVLYREQLEKELTEACKVLVEKFGAIDSEARNLQERSSKLVEAEIAVDLKIEFIKGNFEQVRRLAQKQYDGVKERMLQSHGLSAEKSQEASELLDKCDVAVKSCSDASKRLQIISDQIQIISSFLANNPSVETTVHQAEPASGLADSSVDVERRRFVELHTKTGRLEEENAEYEILFKRFSTEFIEHPERFITSVGGDSDQSTTSPLKIGPLATTEYADDEENGLKPFGSS